MSKASLLTVTGTKSGSIDLPDEIFAAKINPELMAQAVRVYLANQRKSKAKVKTRSDVVGSRRKIWRQKGTGRARHGDRYAPIFVGGGVAHGPTGQENYKLMMSKKMRKRALFSALSSKLQHREILFVRGLEKMEPKTREMIKVLKDLKIENLKITLVLPDKAESVMRAAGNIKKIKLVQAKQLNTYEVLSATRLLFLEKSVGVVRDIFLGRPDRKVSVRKRSTSK